MVKEFECLECGQMVTAKQKHTLEDCEAFKKSSAPVKPDEPQEPKNPYRVEDWPRFPDKVWQQGFDACSAYYQGENKRLLEEIDSLHLDIIRLETQLQDVSNMAARLVEENSELQNKLQAIESRLASQPELLTDEEIRKGMADILAKESSSPIAAHAIADDLFYYAKAQRSKVSQPTEVTKDEVVFQICSIINGSPETCKPSYCPCGFMLPRTDDAADSILKVIYPDKEVKG